ncbi:NAD(P)/FAD-dependent oxidoreductase [Paenibacillus psychroresistens]|uniref:NAD(P)/FAD-dependent oxidoreductase n=1 Tax=Paenibacillus psychroresistens TaxID=1778678 RepID=A0A6B8RIQ7_9BACL|nr:NAD(P)/FAD-dependent oxidoreductase [Paenibacillus psychroresistens]QGQ95266.1 NAD(P)/FAD-dependent oxidoreductase [Paenibacillus psychroresistens]
MIYDCIIVGGGIAGLQGAIQLGRYGHNVIVIDSGNGRSTLCRSYHNLLGWPNGVSGEDLRKLGKSHAESYGIQFITDTVTLVQKSEHGFEITLKLSPIQYESRTLLLATGVMDRFPPFPELLPCLGLTIYVCPDCDGYEIRNRRTIVMGSGAVGAEMALTLSNYTQQLIYINHENQSINDQLLTKLIAKGITYHAEIIAGLEVIAEGRFQGVHLQNGDFIEAERGFIAFGGNDVRTQLAEQLGIERMENKHILTHPRSKMTSVPNVWAAGDAGVHAEQVSVAMGEGALSAIWIHKALEGLNAT